MGEHPAPLGRREREKQEKRRRISAAVHELFAQHGVARVTTQQIADRADVAVGTLYLYASTKAEMLVMVQNEKFAAAIDAGLAAAEAARRFDASTLEAVLALVGPVVACIREQPENGRTYLNELLFGDPIEPHRRKGLSLSLRLEDGLVRTLANDCTLDPADVVTLARVVTAIIHISTTATIHMHRTSGEVLDGIQRQIRAVLPPSPSPHSPPPSSE